MPVRVPRFLSTWRLAGALLVVSLASACSSPVEPPKTTPTPVAPTSSSPAPSIPATPTSTPTPTTPPVALSSNVKDGASKIKVDTLVRAKAAAGTLTKVKLAYAYTDRAGKAKSGTVDGAMNKAKSTWTAEQRLEPSAKYTLTMSGKNAAKEVTSETAAFKTQALALTSQTFPSLYPLARSKVGVGMPVILNFDVPVANKKEVQKNLHVTSSPAQKGTWRWYSDREVHFRPAKYWKPGTKVEVDANLNGVNAGNGIYGQSSASTSFTVGRSLVTKVDLAKDVATVYKNGKQVRKIFVSGGKPGWQTRSGIKLVMGTEFNKKMTNEMIGAKEDYSLTAKYAIRITNSGEFLHSAPWNTGNFGRRNASHGCVGMSEADSGWLYDQVLVGDPVVTTGSSKKMEQGNGYADWNLSYATYRKGSAI